MKQIFLSSLVLVGVTTVLLNIKISDKLSAEPHVEQNKQVISSAEVTIPEQINDAAVTYNIPQTAIVDEPFNVILKIDPSKTDLSKIINVQLNVNADEFKLVNLSTNEQVLFATEPNTWEWELTPLAAGTNHISLGVTAIITIDGKQTNHFINAYSNDIVVTATTNQQIKALYEKHKDKLWGFLVVPLFEWARRKYTKWKEDRATNIK
jgi:hypothetical protein